MGVIVTKYTGSPAGSGSGAYNITEKLAMEMEMEFIAANASYYKELGYDGSENLTDIDIWTDSGKTTQLFDKTFSYDPSGNLSETLLTRVSDSAKILKILGYDGSENLTSVTVSAG
jgi:hypothetical protein